MQLEAVPLTYSAIFSLAGRIRAADKLECNGDVVHAMSHSFTQGGEAWAAMNGSNPVGAFGWTKPGLIWSLWADLSTAEAMDVLRQTPAWTTYMVNASGLDFLKNYVDESNHVTLRWLKAAGCFTVDRKTRYILKGRSAPTLYFRTKLKGAS